MAEIVSISEEREEALAEAVAALRAGGLVGVPTETVYGIAADATNRDAVARIFEAKRRPRFNPLIVHVESVAAARRLIDLDALGAQLAEQFWPGPLTIVAPARQRSPIADLVSAGLDTLAVRVPAHPVMHDLLAAAQLPLAAPSANLSGRVSATTAAHVAADLGDRAALVLDAGPSPLGLESTIVSVAGAPTLLRPGAIAREAIEGALGRSLAGASGGKVAAPGMLASHYAPDVPLRLDVTEIRPGESLLAFGRPLPPGADAAFATVDLSETGDLREAAANLFSALRSLDAEGAPIAVMPIPEDGLGAAINDRLRRAAAPRQS